MKLTTNSVLFWLAVAGLLVHHFFFFYGHFGYDDLHYAGLAHDLFNTGLDLRDHYAFRIVPIFLTAVSYALFGVNDFASGLPALLATTLILYLIYWHFRTEKWWKFLLALGLFFSLKWNLFYADKLMPDVFVSAFVFAGWSLCVRRKRVVLAAFCLFLAFNAKGTLILALPLFLWLAAADLWRGRYRFWIVFSAANALLLAAYFGAIKLLTGSATARLTAIADNSYLNDCSYDQLPTEHLLERLTTGYLDLIVGSWLFLHLLIAGLVVLFVSKVAPPRRPEVWSEATAVGVVFLSINFMTISMTSYNPICTDSRHLLLFAPILSVYSLRLLGLVFTDERTARHRAWFYPAVVVAFGLLLLPALKFAHYGTTLKYAAMQTNFRQLIREVPRPATIYGSEVLKNYGRYFSSFAAGENELQFLNVENLPKCPGWQAKRPVFLVRNWYADWHADFDDKRLEILLEKRGLRTAEAALEIERFTVLELHCAVGN